MLDEHGYPDDASLEAIKNWDHVWKEDGMTLDLEGLLSLVRDNLKYADGPGWSSYDRQGNLLAIHTGGWSGNEDTIDALMSNWMFRSLCWRQTHRGGHYYFYLANDFELEDKETEGIWPYSGPDRE